MKKFQLDLTVADNRMVGPSATLLTLQYPGELPDMVAGQFAELQVPSAKVMLRRPISIHDVDIEKNQLTILVQVVGKGTKTLSQMEVGETLNLVYPLGRGNFSFAPAPIPGS